MGSVERLRRAAFVFAASVLLIVLAGSIYKAVATGRERRLFPPLGRLVDAGGYRLHVHCMGATSPTVVFESGFGMSSNAWALVQPAVARLTRACSYDRPGYGWSDEAPDPRTGTHAVDDLHRMLANAGIPGPYGLVGHSMGEGRCDFLRAGIQRTLRVWLLSRLETKTGRRGTRLRVLRTKQWIG